MKIYVGNLPFDASQTSVRDLFSPFGTVNDVALINDRDTGRPRGFGFVEMPEKDAAIKALDGLNGQEFGGRQLNVNEAKSQGPR
ncbi:MAG: RNA recognition motif domain-containing protein [Planctomycetota bacterium]|jgi:RNA recognition motif-containing protein